MTPIRTGQPSSGFPSPLRKEQPLRMPRTTGEETKAAIREVALMEFATRGYDSVPLEHIAAEVGITRSAILHHFGSKADLLRELVDPFESALDEIMDAYAGVKIPIALSERHALLARVVDVYCTHRLVLLMLLRDVSSHWPLHINPRMTGRIERLIELLAGESANNTDRVVVDAVLGVVTRPLLDPLTDVDDGHLRRLLVTIALDVAKRLGNAASRSWSDNPPASR